MAAIAAGPTVGAAPADTGSVYFDSNFNVGAGRYFFNGSFSGASNVGLGYSVMPNLTAGNQNVATGDGALFSDTTGFNNVATGYSALFSNSTGNSNVASGYSALALNTSGHDNVAAGFDALLSNTAGFGNVASGTDALTDNDGGNNNVASGFNALAANTSGNRNLAAGYQALAANTTGSNNLALGPGAGANLTSGSNNVDIASPGVAGEARKIRIGTPGTQTGAFIAGIAGKSIPGPTQTVLVNGDGQLGTATSSSRRLKREIRPLRGAASRRLLSLDPVSYRYRGPTGLGQPRQYGLLAGQVARRLPALAERGPSGRPTGVYYQELPALLLAQVKRQAEQIHRLRELVHGGG